MIHPGHEMVMCECGHLVGQCRCMEAKPVRIVRGCQACTPVKPTIISPGQPITCVDVTAERGRR